MPRASPALPLTCAYTVCTLKESGLRFEWDPDKAAANEWKHGVTFDEASSVFSDDRAILLDDPDHSDDEDRFLVLGLSASLRILVVCHAYREDEDVVRVISARKATRRERHEYAERWKP